MIEKLGHLLVFSLHHLSVLKRVTFLTSIPVTGCEQSMPQISSEYWPNHAQSSVIAEAFNSQALANVP